ncbi:MAG: stage V sporulation protein AD [Clostridia bacterium]|nr:stage V sporulation protein AD [Clostridia bacterium]
MRNRIGRQTLLFRQPPQIISSAAIVSQMEAAGPLGEFFDTVMPEDTWGEESWEKAERKMFISSVHCALSKLGMQPEALDCLLGGDLLNQLISANYAARELNAPFLGLYSACSTMTESLLLGSVLLDGGYANHVACVATSHFCTAERQYRLPLEMGGQNPPTAQRTVTAAGCTVLCAEGEANARVYHTLCITHGTIGRVVDLGITDAANMGAAMAPAAADTLATHLKDTGRALSDYDLVVTGDLGSFGSTMFRELCAHKGLALGERHLDCGNAIFDPNTQNVDCGGSGCGCSAAVLNGYLLKRMEAGDFKRAIIMATGALLSPTATMQSDSIPGIAHAVVLERRSV